jgi:hypothetical protein
VLPQNFAGLLLLAASICPGYWWIRVLEERKPRRDRTQLLEAAELLSIGGLFSAISFLLAFVFVDRANIISAQSFLNDTHRYAQHHAIRLAIVVLVTLVIANVAAFVAARVIYRGGSQIVHESGLHRAVAEKPAHSRALVTAVLHDGTAISGWFHACTADPASPDQQELVLVRIEEAPPNDRAVRVRLPHADGFAPLKDHCVVLSGAQLAATYVRFVRTSPAPAAPRAEST